MNAHRFKFCITVIWVCAFAWAPWAWSNSGPSTKLSAELQQALTDEPNARALVVFDLPVQPPGLSNAEAERRRREEIAAIVSGLSNQFGASLGNARSFDQVAALATRIDQATALALASRPDVKLLDVDQRLSTTLETAIPLLGMDVMHALTDPIGGVQGQGAKLAVIDSGVSAIADLADAVVAEACFCVDCCVAGSDEAYGPGSAEDTFGHGTRVLGTAVSRGVNTGVGPAPEASAVVAKVVAADGSMFLSDVIAALDWVADWHPDVDVVNLSLGTSLTFPGHCNGEASWLDVLEEAVDLVMANGALVVASAGNGAVHTEMSAPACLSQVIGVGATYVQDYIGVLGFSACTDTNPLQDSLACFSNVSDTTDVMAPGAVLVVPGLDGSPCSGCGTSFSAPLVSGCLAQIMAAEPSAAAEVVRAAVSNSSVMVTAGAITTPRLDCLSAYRAVRTVFYDSFEGE